MSLECFCLETSRFSIMNQIIRIGFQCASITVGGGIGNFIFVLKLPIGKLDQTKQNSTISENDSGV